MRKLIFAFTLIFLLISKHSISQSFTQVEDIKALEILLLETSKKTNSIISDFIQEKHLDFIDEKITSKGKFWLRDENSLRWEYTEPFSHIIIIHDGKFITKDDSGKFTSYDISSNQVFKEVNNLIVSSARGDLMADGKFEVTAFENQTSYLLKLIPKDPQVKQVISETELYFDKKSLTVSKVIMIENEKDYTVISFVNREINAQIPDSTFVTN